MRTAAPALAALLIPSAASAHDAFGDLGPFYASLLHPLADPLQAALIIGAAAILAARPLASARVGLPLLIGAAAVAHVALVLRPAVEAPALLPAVTALAAGGAAMLPARLVPRTAALVLVAAAGAVAGGLADRAAGAAFQPLLGTLAGLALAAILVWAALDLLARRATPIAPAVAGSWVAAVGLLVAAFVLGPAGDGMAERGALPAQAEAGG